MDVEIWQGGDEHTRWLAAGHLQAQPGQWTLHEIDLASEARAGEPVHLRVVAPSGIYVHRMALES